MWAGPTRQTMWTRCCGCGWRWCAGRGWAAGWRLRCCVAERTPEMATVLIGMTMSLDGFVEDRSGDVSRLYSDLKSLRYTEMLQESIRATGAVVMGRRAY